MRQLAELRQQARLRREYSEADALRRELEALGWEARDRPGGFELVPIA